MLHNNDSRSNFIPPGPLLSDGAHEYGGAVDDQPGSMPEIAFTDQYRQSVRDGLERVTTLGRKRYLAGAEALDKLAELAEDRRRVEAETRHWVRQARRCKVTWSEIGEALGVSQQAASKRFGSGSGVFEEFNDPTTGHPMVRFYQQRLDAPINALEFPVRSFIRKTADGMNFSGDVVIIDETQVVLKLRD
jgi:hypothetical protein